MSDGAVPVRDDESIARFIFSKRHFKSGRAVYAAFLPHDGTTSVFRIEGLFRTRERGRSEDSPGRVAGSRSRLERIFWLDPCGRMASWTLGPTLRRTPFTP